MRANDDDHLRERVGTELVRFVRALRREGASVPANAATTAGRALAAVGLSERDRTRAALRASLLTDRDDFETFDRLFSIFWRRLVAEGDELPSSLSDDAPDGGLASLAGDAGASAEHEEESSEDADGGEDAADRHETATSLAESFAAASPDAADDRDSVTAALYSPSGSASAVERVRPADSDSLETAFGELTRALGGLEGRRFESGSERPDVRRALRASASTGGTVPELPERERKRTAVRVRFLVDVSRSVLDALDRGFLLDVLRRASHDWRDVRVFFFDEDLREVTVAVDAPSAGAAAAALEAAETEWGGGTRIGHSLARLRETAPEAVDRRTVTVVVSDGLEMGDVDALERELAWLSRRSKRVLWLNPLAASEGYEPTARGMAAALPYVDGLFAFAGPDDVAELARQLRRRGAGGRVGYEFDARTA